MKIFSRQHTREKRISRFMIALIVIVSISCSESITDSVDFENQRYLFEIEFFNNAWGWNHSGYVINNSAEVYSYRYNGNPEDRWSFHKDGRYTEQELLEKFSHSREFVSTVNVTDLMQMASLIPGTVGGRIVETGDDKTRDGGVLTYKCFVFDAAGKTYQEIKLREERDSQTENDTPSARLLTRWLRTQRETWLESRNDGG